MKKAVNWKKICIALCIPYAIVAILVVGVSIQQATGIQLIKPKIDRKAIQQESIDKLKKQFSKASTPFEKELFKMELAREEGKISDKDYDIFIITHDKEVTQTYEKQVKDGVR